MDYPRQDLIIFLYEDAHKATRFTQLVSINAGFEHLKLWPWTPEINRRRIISSWGASCCCDLKIHILWEEHPKPVSQYNSTAPSPSVEHSKLPHLLRCILHGHTLFSLPICKSRCSPNQRMLRRHSLPGPSIHSLKRGKARKLLIFRNK